eukprot:TRINITY_DN62301_c0_g1_i1.p1 TRINITY_DN62301_c0_g1~~TRINITY_DN62301_c0_g1_i1.p1  ORF type:complete len:540 (+),score=54.35 TRINITY_DN62301_c0_g1_i1:62-1621(+)
MLVLQWLVLFLALVIKTGSLPNAATQAVSSTVVNLDLSHVRHQLPLTFGSFTVDAGQLFEGVFWNNSRAINFSDTSLRALTAALGPSLLRVGGTDADRIFYNLSDSSNTSHSTPPLGFKYVLSGGKAQQLFEFAQGTGTRLVLGLNGVGPRVAGKWVSDNAEDLVKFACHRFPHVVEAWELGNEPNLWLANFKILVHSAQLVEDFKTLRQMLQRYAKCTATKLVGPDVALQLSPTLLEHLAPSMAEFIQAGGSDVVDALSYHWYPLDGREQSKLIDPYYATPARATNLETLDKGDRLAKHMGTVANGTALWTGETALAAFGGQAQVSQTWAGVLYWADALGTAAANGQQEIIRQTLCGAHYGLLDPNSNCSEPNPDYWILWVHKQLMGSKVLRATASSSHIRAYAHCSRKITSSSTVTLLLLNVANVTSCVSLNTTTNTGQAYVLTPFEGNLEAGRTMLNGVELKLADNRLPELSTHAVHLSNNLLLEPYAVAFVTLAGTDASRACASSHMHVRESIII